MKIGFIGLGIMGESMCENIVKKHDDTVYCFDFVPAKVELLASNGAVPCKIPWSWQPKPMSSSPWSPSPSIP